MPGKPLSERISAPGGRSRSLSPHRRYDEEDAARRGIDRYVPGGGSRSRSPMPPRRGAGGRRPGARREGGRDQDAARGGQGGQGGQGGRGGRGGARAERTNTPRSKKTQEELDAEMEDYFNANGGAAEPAAEAAAETAAPSEAAPALAHADDIDMIE